MKNYLLLILILILFDSTYLLAQKLNSFTTSNVTPLRALNDVHSQGVNEEVLKLERAQVLIADYELIRRDFSEISHYTNDEIDKWLVSQTGFISQGQAIQTNVNSSIPTTFEKRSAYRPPEYGRALVYSVTSNEDKMSQIGVIDVKGAGGVNPSFRTHNSGTMTLGESLREFSYEKMITTVIDHSGINKQVVGAYAVIAPGFDVLFEDGSKEPAGLYLRQGHRRYTRDENYKRTGRVQGNGWMDPKWRTMYDNLLGKYGVFANGNYQGTISNDLFDFGHYIVRNDIKGSLDKLIVPFDQWGFELAAGEKAFDITRDRWKMSKRDFPWNWSHDTGRAFVEGRANRHHVWLNHYNLLNPVQEKLKSVPRQYDESKKLGFTIKECHRVFHLK